MPGRSSLAKHGGDATEAAGRAVLQYLISFQKRKKPAATSLGPKCLVSRSWKEALCYGISRLRVILSRDVGTSNKIAKLLTINPLRLINIDLQPPNIRSSQGNTVCGNWEGLNNSGRGLLIKPQAKQSGPNLRVHSQVHPLA